MFLLPRKFKGQCINLLVLLSRWLYILLDNESINGTNDHYENKDLIA